MPLRTTAQIEHDRMVTEAREKGGAPGRVLAAYAGATAAKAGLDIDNPFTAHEAALSEGWRRGRALGLSAPIPAASIHPLPPRRWMPRPGTTHAARTAQEEF
ncbi:hypothetical protein [Magnetospirillum molischianum]|uniref:Uncharacterized protein n=1 Tax=Magnetospirillum molischianum DSM 120 TaxID=1150626 RepID=H8FUW7_MAGML|nr:hypothetical protein [Magnetospirillum molischianum]CCG42155.1 hypothetical protein PHAMO_340028 [Magnetospirillum molischianum DSM 120]